MSDQDANIFEDDNSSTEPQAQTPTETPTEEPTPTEAQTQEPSTDPFEDLLKGITNDDGSQKYTSVESALNSVSHAQSHINTLESDNAELKARAEKAEAAQELLRKQVGNKQTVQPLDEGTLVKVVDAVLNQRTEASNKAENLSTVSKQFTETYGNKAKDQMKKIAADNQVSLSFLKNLAETSPAAVFNLAGINQSTPIPPKNVPENKMVDIPVPRTETKPKSVMGGATTSDLTEAWRKAGEGLS